MTELSQVEALVFGVGAGHLSSPAATPASPSENFVEGLPRACEVIPYSTLIPMQHDGLVSP
jgi:hypothetical protein